MLLLINYSNQFFLKVVKRRWRTYVIKKEIINNMFFLGFEKKYAKMIIMHLNHFYKKMNENLIYKKNPMYRNFYRLNKNTFFCKKCSCCLIYLLTRKLKLSISLKELCVLYQFEKKQRKMSHILYLLEKIEKLPKLPNKTNNFIQRII